MDGELQKAVDIWFQTDLRRDDAENLLTQQPVGKTTIIFSPIF